MKGYKFFAHFNRNNMQRKNPNVWTLHYRGQCIQCEEIIFNVRVKTQFKPDGRQPRATLRGVCVAVMGSSDDKRMIVV